MRGGGRALGLDLPAFALSSVNRIPLERGLGSSAAAAVAGIELATALLGPRSARPNARLDLASRLEGHPDNAAAAHPGGLTIAFDDRAVRARSLPDLRPVVLIPERRRLATTVARDALPTPGRPE